MSAYEHSDLLRLAAGASISPDAFQAILRDRQAVERLATMARLADSFGGPLPPLDDIAGIQLNWEELARYAEGRLADPAAVQRVEALLREHFPEALELLASETAGPSPAPARLPSWWLTYADNAWQCVREVRDHLLDGATERKPLLAMREAGRWLPLGQWLLATSPRAAPAALAGGTYDRLTLQTTLDPSAPKIQMTAAVELRGAERGEALVLECALADDSPVTRAYLTVLRESKPVTGRRVLLPGRVFEFELELPAAPYELELQWNEGSTVRRQRVLIPVLRHTSGTTE
jgi:hypothetical protein